MMGVSKDLKIGILVPSSNTALEPLTTAILSCYAPASYYPNPSSSSSSSSSSSPSEATARDTSLPTITLHVSRFSVTEISLSADAINQFSISSSSSSSNSSSSSSTSTTRSSPILAAAKLLIDANVSVIGWSGTSAGWLGFETDESLCRLIESETGGTIPATTSTLALNRALHQLNLPAGAAFGMVTPYRDDVQSRIGEVYAAQSPWTVVESHLGIARNWDIAEVGEEVLESQLRSVLDELSRLRAPDSDTSAAAAAAAVGGGGGSGADEERNPDGFKVVSTFCTNLKAAHLAERWETKYPGLVLLDTVSTVIWDCLRILGRPKGEVKGWGKLFEL